MEGVFLMTDEILVNKVKNTLIEAGSSFSREKTDAYERAIARETNARAKWILETILENAQVAEARKSPLCDDTGIPHIVLEIGKKSVITGQMIEDIHEGVAEGLRELPGRPMAIIGDEIERIDQSCGISPLPEDVVAAPIIIKESKEDISRLHILMFGGGPAIRGKTYRVFHKHNADIVISEIVEWAKEAVSLLGCSPCTLAIGIGRSQFEASAMMVESLIEGNYNRQSTIEKKITDAVNAANIGPLGLGGDTSVLATFLKVGPQRASGVRIVCIRPCCCFEPRMASVDL